MIKIVVDAMGGDHAPVEIVKGAVLALQEKKNFSLIFTGDEALVREELRKYKYDASRVEVVHCSEVITNDDVPTQAVRTKRDSSLVVGLKLLKDRDDVAGFVSAGSTGAVLAGGIMFVGRIKGVMRPALCPAIPNATGSRTLLCDCGANAECKPSMLAQFAVMASAYARSAYGIKNPRVGLLSNGTEQHKGDLLHQEANALIREAKNVNFIGNVEGRDIMYGDADVVVADGFSGNIALKSIEGCGKTVSDILSKAFRKSFGSRISYLFAKKQLKKLKLMLDYSAMGGTIFLGLQKTVIKSHGSSMAKSITPSVLQAVDAYEGGLIRSLTESFENLVSQEGGDE